MKRLPSYTQAFIDRHGRPRYYFRRAGFKTVPLPGMPWSDEFMSARAALLNGESAPQREIGSARTKSGSINALAVAYYNRPSSNTSLAPKRSAHAEALLRNSEPNTATSRLPCYSRGTSKNSWPKSRGPMPKEIGSRPFGG
jgi:hypothetical protein